MITLPCSTYHLPMQTAGAHGSHFQMGSLSQRKPIIHRSRANLQIPRRTSLDCRNFVVYPAADRPDPVRTMGGPPHALCGPFPRHTVDGPRATPPTELLDRATGAGRATSCPSLPRWQSRPLRLSAGATHTFYAAATYTNDAWAQPRTTVLRLQPQSSTQPATPPTSL
jgi:hypothetical protein